MSSSVESDGPQPGAEPDEGSQPSERGIAYTVGEAARLAGVSATTVRVWEREGLVESRRSRSGYRYFGEADIARLRRIAYLRRVEKLNSAGIKRVLSESGELESDASGQSNEVRLGARLREIRQKAGRTLEEAAAAAGLSPSFLSSLERDQTGAAPATLHRLMHSYGATLSSLMRSESTVGAQVKHPGHRTTVRSHGVTMEQLVDGQTLLDASITILEPGGGSGGQFAHEGEELVYVLEGQLEVVLGGETYELGPGDSLFYPSSIEHGWSNPGTVTTRTVWVCTPSTF
jgi:DNA-binding transcriptional MerR regulator/quercetin dioxygenase-like cupin family protein